MATNDQIAAGHAVYSPMVLRTYDWIVLGFSNHFLWGCPTRELRQLYDRNVSARHLDVGVGTGYFLSRAKWPVANPAITLLDLNANCLSTASGRIRKYAPETVLANALEPLPQLEPFHSVGLCYLLHCVPGAMPDKALVFDHLRPVLAPGARVFGATILQGQLPRSRPAQALMNLYNQRGIFSNAADTLEDLDTSLRARFSNVTVKTMGVVALFEASAN